MRYEDASGAFQASGPIANDDADTLPAGSRGPATGNLITGEGTQYGAAGADSAVGAKVTALAGKGGEDTSFAAGKLSVAGEFGQLSVDANGNYSYLANAGAPENVRDRFVYTLADMQGNSDTGALIVEIGKTPAVIKAGAQQIVAGPDGVVTLPAGVELSDIMVVGRNLVVNLPDGTQLVIVDGAVFVPQLSLGGVEVPATNVAALLIGQEPQPAAGETPPSSGGNFALPPPPLDPGIPLGDLLPPTQLVYVPPEPQEVLDIIDREPEIFIQPDGQPASVAAVDAVEEAGLPGPRLSGASEPPGSGEGADGNGADNDVTTETTGGVILINSPDGVASVTINGFLVTGLVGQQIPGAFGTLTITGFSGDDILYSYTLRDNISHNDAVADHDDFLVVLTDDDGDQASATLAIDIVDDVPTARPDTDALSIGQNVATGNVLTDASAGDASDGDNGADTVGADNASITIVSSANVPANSDNSAPFTVNGQYGVLVLNADGSYTYTRNADTPGGVTDVFNYTITDSDGDTSSTTLTITIPDATPSLGTPAIAQSDDEIFPPSNAGGTGDANPNQSNMSGNLAGSGGDGDLDYAFTGANTLPAGFTASVNPAGTVMEISQTGVGVVLTITLNLETGAYSIVHNQPIDHPTSSTTEEDVTFGIGVRVVDADGDSAVNTLTINVDDDTPLANNDTDSITSGGSTATGNVITGVGTNEGAGNADLPGADTFDTITALSGSGGSDTNPAGGFTATGTHGTLQMDAAGNYTYTRANGNPISATDIFTYTYKDDDGDLASATLTITIQDAAPLLGTPLTAQSDDEIFAGGNPGALGGGDASPNQSNMSGTLAGSGGDGALTYSFTGTNTLPAGFSIDPSSTATSLKIAQVGVGIVVTIDLNLATGQYTITHNQPIDHPTSSTTEEDVTFGIGVRVTDADGDTANNTLTINVDDDTPLANNDTDAITSGGSTATGNVITGVGTTEGAPNADSPGADTFDTITALSGSGGSDSDPAGGFVVNGTHGQLVMDANGNYTYTRANGNPISATDIFTYTYKDDDGDLASATLTITIQDAAPLLGTPLTAQSDDEIFAGGNAGALGGGDASPNQSNMSGTLAGSGGDGALTYSFSGTNTLPAGFSIDPSSTATSLKIAQVGVGIVVTIDLNLSTGLYTITHNQPIDHPTSSTTEEDVQFLIGVRVTDVDGDTANNTLTINVDDDTPLANNDTDTVAAGTASGNVITGVGTNEGAGNADSPGADTFDTITALSGSGGSDTNASGGFNVNGTHGSLAMDANGNYTYTRNAGTPGGVTDTFTYTYKDDDGDLASATLTITIPDALPLLGTPLTAQSDDEIFAGGNAGALGGGDASPNQSNMSGTLAGSGGDGTLTYSFSGTNTLPAGFSIDPSSTATSLKIAQVGVGIVVTIDLNLATGVYTITHNQPIDHPTSSTTEEDVTFGIGVRVTDVDGDTANNTLTINVDDDTPLANNDTDTVAAGTASGNVITGVGTTAGAGNADSPGADTFDTITALSGSGGSDTDATGGFDVNGTHGTLAMEADGSYVYTRNAGTPGGVTDIFTYTYKDDDGDLASATLTITIPDALPLLGTPLTAQSDDEIFAGGNPGALGGGDANPNQANMGGTLAGSGGDGPLAYSFSGTNTLPAGFSIDPTSTPTSLKIAQVGVGIVMTIDLNLSSGVYTITHNQPIDHPTSSTTEEDVTFGIGVRVTDVDGDTANNTLTINVDDDTPLANNDTDTVSAGTASGNVITGVGTTEGPGNADSPGADTFDTITALSGSGGSDTNATGGFDVSGTHGTLAMETDGSYVYTRNAGTPGGVTDTFTYTYKDDDGDLASATLTITIPDATPLLGTPLTAQSDDEIFAGGIAGAVSGDADPNQVNMSGTLAGSGGDGPLAYSFSGTNTLPAGFSIDPTSTATSLKIAQAGVGIVMTIDLNLSTGLYTITHNQPIDHPTPGTFEEDVTFAIGVRVTDVDGDTANNTLTINVDDDTPTLGTIQNQDVSNNPAGPMATGTLHYANGADVSPIVVNITANNTGITSGTKPLVTNVVGNVLTAYQDNGVIGTYEAGIDTVAVYTLTVNPSAGTSGQYVFDLQTALDPVITPTPIGGSSSFGAGPSVQGFVLESATGTDLAVISGYNTNGSFNFNTWFTTGVLSASTVAAGGVNGSTAGWGVDDNNFDDPNELFFFDFGAQALANPDGDPAPPGPDDADYQPPAGVTLPNISFATFDFINYVAGNDIAYVVHLVNPDGTSAGFESGFVPSVHMDGSSNADATNWTYTAPSGKFIGDIQFFSGANDDVGNTVQNLPPGKIDLVSVGVESTSINKTISFTVTLSDADGDSVSGGFTVNVADGNVPDTPAAATLPPDPQSSMMVSMEPANDDSFSSFSSNGNQKWNGNAWGNVGNTGIVAGALAASGMMAMATTSLNGFGDPLGSQVDYSFDQFSAQLASRDGFEDMAFTSLSLGTDMGRAGFEAISLPGSGFDFEAVMAGSHSLDAHGFGGGAADYVPAYNADLFGSFGADYAAAAAPPAVAMVSAEALQALALDGPVQHAGFVEEIMLDALTAAPTIDGLLAGLPGGGMGELTMISQLASPAGDAVPTWDMNGFGAFGAGADMVFKVDAAMLHHDAVQPVING